jgi:5-methyltetrahydrofolate--homocysteine methyltransferase
VEAPNGDIYIPEVAISARAMHAASDVLKPVPSKSNSSMAGEIVIGAVKEDPHDIGKNLVTMMLEGGGFEVLDFRVDVSPESFVGAVQKHKPQATAMSALLTAITREIKTTLDAIAKCGLKNQVKTILGGPHLTEKFVKEIGTDGYASDAASAVDAIKSVLT